MRAFILLSCLLFAGCTGVNRLAEHDLADRAVAVRAAVPRAPVVAGYPWLTADRARRDFDAAVRRVDIAARIARKATAQSAGQVGYQPVKAKQQADYALDIRIYDYGLAGHTLFVEGDVFLLDARTDEVIWKRPLNRRRDVYGPIRNADDIVQHLARLADSTAEDVARALQRDHRRARS